MDAKKRHLMVVLLVGGLVFVGLTVLNGCGKDEPSPAASTQSGHDHDGPDHAHGDDAHSHEHAETAMSEVETAKEIDEIEQKTCPVMVGNPINTQYFVEYQGKKVYFCCPGCDKKFAANPGQYLAKLPQFQE